MCCGLNSIDVVSEQGEDPFFAPANSVGSKALVSSDFKGFIWLQMCFLDATDSDVVFMEDMLQVCLLVEDTLCVPMHHIDCLMSLVVLKGLV